MDVLQGIMDALSVSALAYALLGAAFGMLFGMVPGLTATMGVALLTPLAFNLSPANGLALILGVYNAAMFGSGITAILINTPGTPASIASTFDGYPLTKQGQGNLALGINALGGFVGSVFGLILLAIVAVPLANFAITFGPPEYFALAIFGLSMMISVSGKSIVKGLIAGAFGMLLATVGLDPILGYPRFTFGNLELLNGIPFIPIMIGLFGVAEVLSQIREGASKKTFTVSQEDGKGRLFPSLAQWKRLWRPVGIGSAVGTFIGAIPGAGGDIASLISWDLSRQTSKKPEEFGKGSIEGLAASETANNSVIGGAMATMLALGIPGDAPTAVLIGTLLIWGLQPGPLFFRDHLPLFYTIVGTLLVSTVFSFILSVVRARSMVGWLTRISPPRLWAVVLAACIVGTYSLNNSLQDVWIILIFGVIGLFLREFEFPPGPIVLGLILGPMAESNLRRSLILLDNNLLNLVERPVAAILLIAAMFALVLGEWQRTRSLRKTAAAAAQT